MGFGGILRQSTAVNVIIGPFVDSTDGDTEETALTIAQADVRLSKNAGADAQKSDATTCAHEGDGFYMCELDATDTNTVGQLALWVHVAGALAVRADFQVIEEAAYDLLFAASATGQVTVAALGANVITAAATAADFSTEVNAAVLAVLGALNDAAADGAVTTTDTMVAYLKQIINTLEGAPGIVTYPASATPGNGVSMAEVLRQIYDEVAGLNGGALLDAAGVRSAVGLASANLDTQLSAIDDFLDTEVAAILAAVDTEVAAIKAKTDNLPADPADASDIAALFALLRGFTIANGTIGSTGNSTTALHLSGLTYGDDEINNYLLVVLDVSAGEYHSRWIEDWADTGDLATVATLPFTPENAVDTYWIFPIRQDVTGGSGLDAAGVRAAVGLASANLDTQLAAIDDFLDTEVAAILAAVDTEVAAILADTNELQTDWTNGGRLDLLLDAILEDTGTTLQAELDGIQADTEDIQARLPAALVGGRIDASVGAMAANVMTAAAAAADLTTELQSGLATAAALAALDAKIDTIDDFLDTEIAAILEDTGTTIDDLVDDLEARMTAALADKLTAHAAAVLKLVVGAGSTTTAVVFSTVEGAAPSGTNDFYNGRVIIFTSGALAGQATSIDDYVGATTTATVPALTGAPAQNVTAVIV